MDACGDVCAVDLWRDTRQMVSSGSPRLGARIKSVSFGFLQPVTHGPGCRVEPSAHGEEFNGTKHAFKTSANPLAGMRAVLVCV